MSPVLSQFAVPLTSIHNVEADGVKVFYREAGDPSAPVVLLLHGFPTSSFMFRELIPRLADRFRVIAPDLPGFGFTEVPEGRNYTYSFDALARTIEAFTEALGLNRYAIYVFDYGAPTGLRLAMAHPERGARGRVGTHSEILGRTHSRKSRSDSKKHLESGRDALAIHAWSSKAGKRRARVVYVGCRPAGTSGKQGNSARFVSGLCLEREVVSKVPGILPQVEAAFACNLGQE
jgi:pimeloyl-ACP methyl ester carboxylesterase